jgi:hypothetical protein
MLCPPSLAYLIVSVGFLAWHVYSSFNASTIAFNAIFVGVWTWFLNHLCRKGYLVTSWLLVIVPWVFMAVVFLYASKVLADKKRASSPSPAGI